MSAEPTQEQSQVEQMAVEESAPAAAAAVAAPPAATESAAPNQGLHLIYLIFYFKKCSFKPQNKIIGFTYSNYFKS